MKSHASGYFVWTLVCVNDVCTAYTPHVLVRLRGQILCKHWHWLALVAGKFVYVYESQIFAHFSKCTINTYGWPIDRVVYMITACVSIDGSIGRLTTTTTMSLCKSSSSGNANSTQPTRNEVNAPAVQRRNDRSSYYIATDEWIWRSSYNIGGGGERGGCFRDRCPFGRTIRTRQKTHVCVCVCVQVYCGTRYGWSATISHIADAAGGDIAQSVYLYFRHVANVPRLNIWFWSLTRTTRFENVCVRVYVRCVYVPCVCVWQV